MTAGWTPAASDRPSPPTNVMAMSPYEVGVFDLRWDDPSILAANTVWEVVGVNIYRSDASDRGPYRRINEFPVGGSFYRDQTLNVLVSKEVVDWGSSWLSKGDSSNNRRWSFRTQHPIVKKSGQNIYGNAISDVASRLMALSLRCMRSSVRQGKSSWSINQRLTAQRIPTPSPRFQVRIQWSRSRTIET